MEPCQGPAERIDASYNVKIYCLWRGNEVNCDIHANCIIKVNSHEIHDTK